MKILHISDCHLGGWKNQKLEELNFEAFRYALSIGIKRKVDAVIISGDLFDTPLPSLKTITECMEELKKLKDNGIKIYAISGSHDVTSGIGAITLLEAAGIIKNIDFRKSNDIDYFIDGDLFIIGLSGKKLGKEIYDVKELRNFLEKNKQKFIDKKKILVIHSAIDGLVELPIEAIRIDEMPPYFDYYALGHIHIKKIFNKGKKVYAYPGPTFPNNFEELEKLNGIGGAIIINLDENKIEEINIDVCEIISLKFNADNKNPFSLTQEIMEKLKKLDISNKIITVRIEGKLKDGSPGQVDFTKINELAEKKGAILLKNTIKLTSKEFEVKDIDIDLEGSLREIEKKFISEFDNKETISKLITLLDTDKKEGETNFTFEERLLKKLNEHEKELMDSLK